MGTNYVLSWQMSQGKRTHQVHAGTVAVIYRSVLARQERGNEGTDEAYSLGVSIHIRLCLHVLADLRTRKPLVRTRTR